MPTQPDTFHFSQHHPHHQNNAQFFHVTMDGVGDSSGGGSAGARIHTGGAAFAAPAFQLPGTMSEGQFLRRTGPLHQQQHPQPQFNAGQQQQPQQGLPLNQYKYTKVVNDRSEIVPEFFIGANRAPLLSQPIRYDGIPMSSLVYATTGSPMARATANPISSFLMAQQQQQHQPHSHLEKTHIPPHHHRFTELSAASTGQNPLVRIRSEIGSPNGGMLDTVKYLEIPSGPTAVTHHNVHIMDTAADGSRIAPVMVSAAPPPTWTQTRNLPKREQKHPYFLLPRDSSFNHLSRFIGQSTRAALKTSATSGSSTAREIRANNNLPEKEKMDEPTTAHLQSSIQVRPNNKGIMTIPTYLFLSVQINLHCVVYRSCFILQFMGTCMFKRLSGLPSINPVLLFFFQLYVVCLSLPYSYYYSF